MLQAGAALAFFAAQVGAQLLLELDLHQDWFLCSRPRAGGPDALNLLALVAAFLLLGFTAFTWRQLERRLAVLYCAYAHQRRELVVAMRTAVRLIDRSLLQFRCISLNACLMLPS